MNRISGVEKFFSSTQGELLLFPTLLKLFTQIDGGAGLASDLSSAFAIQEFQLGEEVVNYNIPIISINSVCHEKIEENFYLVCQGRVRLLAIDTEQNQEISAAVLEVGEIFGGDHLFEEIVLTLSSDRS